MQTLVLLVLTAVASAAADAGFLVSPWQGPQAIPTVLPSGYLADTPEVAAARSAHEAEHARARSPFGFPTVGPIATPLVGAFPTVGPIATQHVGPIVGPIGTPVHYRQQVYRGPLANLRVLPSGFIEDTPEVTNARNLHLAQHPRVGDFGSIQAATPQVLADTPEVAYARNAHLAEHARAAYNAYYNIQPQQQRFF